VLGWELTQGLMTDQGFYDHGLLYVQYYSGEGENKKGCRPDLRSRLGLLNLVLAHEKDLFDFENADELRARYGACGRRSFMPIHLIISFRHQVRRGRLLHQKVSRECERMTLYGERFSVPEFTLEISFKFTVPYIAVALV